MSFLIQIKQNVQLMNKNDNFERKTIIASIALSRDSMIKCVTVNILISKIFI